MCIKLLFVYGGKQTRLSTEVCQYILQFVRSLIILIHAHRTHHEGQCSSNRYHNRLLFMIKHYIECRAEHLCIVHVTLRE